MDLLGCSELVNRDLLTSLFKVGAGLVEGNGLGLGPELKAVEVGPPSDVLDLDGLVVEVVVLEELLHMLVAAQGHQLQLLLSPGVHAQTAHERNTRAHRPVQRCAVHANKHPEVHRGPLGVAG